MPLKAVFFDIDDTLYSTTQFAEKARRNSIRAMIEAGLRADEEECYAELLEVIQEFSSNYPHHYEQLVTRLPKESLRDLNRSLLVARAVVAYHQTKVTDLKPYPDAMDLLKGLSNTPLILGVISSGLTLKQCEKLVRLGVLPWLNSTAIYISQEVGIGKPNVKLYQRVCRDFLLLPNEVMYVGNDPRMDIDPPNKLGMITVRVSRPEIKTHPPGETEPDHTISTFDELGNILKTEYGIAPSAEASTS